MAFAIHGMRAGLVELSAPAAPRKPAEIAAEMMFCSKLGYVAGMISLPAAWLMISAFRRTNRHAATANQPSA
ncbi:hypothetical protein NZK35_00855 [Stieleria sp. ICT_E10.1]|uniref:hypothetical protein n=1 Tax=Stieleria sedimenti TaxID=2976331 RepID=UPI00218014D1|nr:hypothetical protein [Stieleria sedimenti]MCS7465217.1 hypothetical protein [Stieleria sedimenti]